MKTNIIKWTKTNPVKFAIIALIISPLVLIALLSRAAVDLARVLFNELIDGDR